MAASAIPSDRQRVLVRLWHQMRLTATMPPPPPACGPSSERVNSKRTLSCGRSRSPTYGSGRATSAAPPSVRWEARFRPAGRCLTPRSGECGTALRAVSAVPLGPAMCRVTLQDGESGHALRAVGSSIPSCRPLRHAAERRMWHRTPCGERHWALQCAGSRCRVANLATPSVRWEARFRPAGRCLTPRSGECGTALRAVSAAIGPCNVPGHAAGWRIWPRPPCGGKLDSVLQAAASRRGAANVAPHSVR